jgi:hypothetical protein
VVEFTEGCWDGWLFFWLFFLERGSLGIIGWRWLLMAYSSYFIPLVQPIPYWINLSGWRIYQNKHESAVTIL